MKLLLEFPDALFHGVDEGSILGDDEVSSSQALWTVRKCHNFRSDRWIAIKLLLEFPDALFHGVDEGSIPGTKKRLRLERRYRFNSNWNTVQLLGHIWSCRSWISA